MAEEKNILEEAIIQMKNLEEAVAENAKGILGSVMRQEIKELVKESLNEQEDDEEVDSEEDESDIADVEFEDEDEMDDEDMEDEMDDEDMEDEMDDEDMEDEMDDEDMEDEFEDDEEMEDDEDVTIDLTNEPIENVMKVFSRMKDTDKITVVEDGEGNIELSDDETNKEYYIVREGLDMDEEMYEMDEPIYELEMETDEEMDMMEMDDMDMMEMDDMDMMEMDDMDMMEMDDMEMDEIMYEVEFDEELDEMDDEYMMEAKKSFKPKGINMGSADVFKYGKVFDYPTKKMKKGDEAPFTGKGPKYEFDKKSPSLKGEFKEGKFGMNKGDKSKTHKGEEDYTAKKGMKSKTHKGLDFEKKETKEASRTLGNGKYWGREGLPKQRAAPRNIRKESIETQEVNLLREKNEEYRKALNVFRNKLNEVAVFNSNLAYATRLFTEHSTSKQEKINILKRFDGVETLKESKNLYKIIKDELTPSKGQQVNESFERTIQKTPSNGSSSNLIESKTYENPQFLRMKDLMSKLK
jgi:hypothetical protein